MINWLFSIFSNKNNQEIKVESTETKTEVTTQEPEKKSCYACSQYIEISENMGVGDNIVCPHCNINNTLVRSGKLIRTERLDIYHKYDGDPYNYNSLGLIGRVRKDFDDEIALAKRARKCEPKTHRKKSINLIMASYIEKKKKQFKNLKNKKVKSSNHF